MKLTDDFYLSEFVKSEFAVRQSIDNTPSEAVIKSLKLLAENILQPIRTRCKKPVVISSGYRSPVLNIAIGGAKNSQHVLGEAADFEVPGMDNKELAKWIIKHLDFDQVILEFYQENDPNSGWVHCSYKPSGNRKSILSANKVNGKTVYTEGI